MSVGGIAEAQVTATVAAVVRRVGSHMSRVMRKAIEVKEAALYGFVKKSHFVVQYHDDFFR